MVPQMVDSIDLSKYILSKCGPMNHLKLQKLLYYCEAYHLAYFGNSIIDDDFEAWLHGPVSRKVWDEWKDVSNLYQDIQLKQSEKVSTIKKLSKELSPEQIDLLDDILKEFSQRSSYQLESLTHRELPWQEARKGIAITDKCTKSISKNTMKKFYSQKLYGES